jgi:hypothetical protein
MGPLPFISFPNTLCPTWATHITLGHLFLYLYISPQLFVIYCTNAFISSHYIIFFVVTFGDLLPSFWPNATHVTLGWSITYHLPLSASSISSEYPTGHLPLPSEFVHLVPPLAQLITGLVVPLTLDLITRLQPLFISYILQPRASLESSHFLTSSMYLCHFLTSVDFMKPFASGSRVPLLSTSAPFSGRATIS